MWWSGDAARVRSRHGLTTLWLQKKVCRIHIVTDEVASR